MRRLTVCAVSFVWVLLLLPVDVFANPPISQWVTSEYRDLGFSFKHPSSIRVFNQCVERCTSGTPHIILGARDSMPGPRDWGISILVIPDMAYTNNNGVKVRPSFEKICRGKLRNKIVLDGQEGIVMDEPDDEYGPVVNVCFKLSNYRVLQLEYRKDVWSRLNDDIISTLRILQPLTSEENIPTPEQAPMSSTLPEFKWKSYTHERDGVTFSYPDFVEIDATCTSTPCEPGNELRFKSKIPGIDLSMHMTFISIHKEQSLDFWYTNNLHRATSPELEKLREVAKGTLGGKEAMIEVGYSNSLRNSSSFDAYCLVYPGRLMHVSFASSDPARNAVFKQVVNSIRFRN